MRHSITDLNVVVAENRWFDIARKQRVGLEFPTGEWAGGRPGDAGWNILATEVEGDTLIIKFEYDIEARIVGAQSYEISEKGVFSILTFFSCKKISYRDPSEHRVFDTELGNNLKLVGYFRLSQWPVTGRASDYT